MRSRAPAILGVVALCAVPFAAQAQLRGADTPDGAPAYHLKPPEISVPPGTKPGMLRRMIQPFGPWTLICDEDLGAHKRLCNTSQTILDAANKLVFSWSLAGTRGGAPVFILRVPAGGNAKIHLDFGRDAKTGVDVALSSCDASVCLGFLPDNPMIQLQINAGASVQVRLPTGTVTTSLAGLAAAVGSLK